jgi:hypothetical protein
VTAAEMEQRVKDAGLCLELQGGIKGLNWSTFNELFKGTLECVCGMGCKRDFPFQSRNECEIRLIGL